VSTTSFLSFLSLILLQPFFHILASSIAIQLYPGDIDDPEAGGWDQYPGLGKQVIATTIVAYALSSVLTGGFPFVFVSVSFWFPKLVLYLSSSYSIVRIRCVLLACSYVLVLVPFQSSSILRSRGGVGLFLRFYACFLLDVALLG